jgi:hypothetical protein
MIFKNSEASGPSYHIIIFTEFMLHSMQCNRKSYSLEGDLSQMLPKVL